MTTTPSFEDFQKTGRESADQALKSFDAVNKAIQAIAAEVADYSKKSFEDSSAVVQQLLGAKTIDKALEVQAAFVKASYETHLARMTKIAELYAALAKETSKPVEAAIAKVK